MLSVLFACSLSADVPGVREPAKWTTDDGRQTTDGAAELAVVFCASRVQSPPIWLSAPLAVTAPDPLAGVLLVEWTPASMGIHPMDRASVRWDVLPSISPEAMNGPADPLSHAFLIPRYWMPLALQESAWLRHTARSRDGADQTGGADMAAMIPRLKKIFVQEGVPHRWVWVAEVESALNAQAVSSAGAAGLFQLMPGTARRFGLQTAPVDDRMEPEKSAAAAAQYLKILHREFGCWSLALAAYNAGEGRVKEIMKKRKARTFSEVERYLPPETRAYVPKVMAVVALREDRFHGIPGAFWMP